MAPKRIIHDYPQFVVVLDELILDNDWMYVHGVPLEDARRRPWYANLLVPYSVVGTTFSFMGPIPEASKLVTCFDDFHYGAVAAGPCTLFFFILM